MTDKDSPVPEHLAHERNYAKKLEDARQAMLRMSQDAAERERRLAARLQDAQQVALRMSQSAAERAGKLSEGMKALQAEMMKLEGEVLRQAQSIGAMTQREAARARQLGEARRRLAQVAHVCAEAHRSLVDISGLEPDAASGARGTKRLLELQGETFVVEAYRLLLHRDPDPSGLAHFLLELDRGTGAAEIVWRIRYSPEGRRIAADVSDIRFVLMRERIYSLPLAGRLFRAIGETCSLIGAQRKRRAFEYKIARKLEEAGRINRELQHKLLWVAQEIAHVEETMSAGTPDRGATDN